MLSTFRAAGYRKQALSAIPRPDDIHVVIAVLSHTVLFFLAPASVIIRHLRFILDFPDNDADIPFYSGVLYSDLYGYEASVFPMSWSAGLGLGFGLEDGWTIAIEAAADITPETDGVLLGGTFKVIPTYAIAPAREWIALSLTLPIAISANAEGAGVSFGIGLSLDLNDHAVN